MNRKSFLRTLTVFTSIIALLTLAIFYFVLRKNIVLAACISFAFIVIQLIIYYSLDIMESETIQGLSKKIDSTSKLGLNIGGVGILVYNDEYEITWMSDYFSVENQEHVGDKLLDWIPETQDVLEGESNRINIDINDECFEITKISDASVLVFKDITKINNYEKNIKDNAYVLGLLNYDNYDEYQEAEDVLTFVNTNIKTPVQEYFKKFNCTFKTLKNNKLLIVLNEAIFKQLKDDRFSILTTIRKVSNDANLDVTLSIAFARGSDNFLELDNALQTALELAQTRGGDQVVVKKIGEDASFFGGTTEAREKQNKTKVRVMLNSIKDLINKADKVIIVGHKNADADCVGSALCMSNICISMNTPTYIVFDRNDIEPMIGDVILKYKDTLYDKHHIISENKAFELLNDNTLVIMVDHHSLDQTSAREFLLEAKQIIIIDHHRRKDDLEIVPLMYYIEASASSTCELVSEFLPYMSRNLEIVPEEANIMYIGLLIDTDRFRVRTGSRTFDVAKQLRSYGADPGICDELIQDPYEMVMDKSYIISQSKQYRNGVLISCVKNKAYNRSVASQACDEMIKAKLIEAVFVICDISANETIITARSKGRINVQTILEKMNGGGHMSAAGVQRKDSNVDNLEKELIDILDEYFKGE